MSLKFDFYDCEQLDFCLLYKLIEFHTFSNRFVVPESPRWLLCKGRVAEVKEIVKKAARLNNIELPENIDKILIPPSRDEETSTGVWELFSSKYLRTVTSCFLCIWFTMNLVYYGLVLNMSSFGGNIYVNSVSFFR